MRPGAWAALLAALAIAGCDAAAQEPFSGNIRIDAVAVPMDRDHPQEVSQGDFAYAGGAALTSQDTSRFGGLSDLKLDAGGGLVAVSDDGDLLRARLRLDDRGRLAGLDEASLRPLLGPTGQPLQGKLQADAEGMALWPNGDLMVSFERDHRIWLYPAQGGPPRPVPKPPVAMPDNEGMEGLALAPSHGPDAYWVGIEGGSIWLCRLSAGCEEQAGLPRPGFAQRLTALAETPDGALVILHHSWNPITEVSAATAWIVRPQAGGAEVLGRLKLSSPMSVDNMEGVDVVPLPGGGLRLILLSDDNFSPKQRTLILAYDWTPPRPAGGAR